MIQTQSPYTYGATNSVTPTPAATFVAAGKQALLALSGAPVGYKGPLAVLISNVGANDGNLLVQRTSLAVPANTVVGHLLKATPTNPILIAELDVDSALFLRCSAATTFEFQVGYKQGNI